VRPFKAALGFGIVAVLVASGCARAPQAGAPQTEAPQTEAPIEEPSIDWYHPLPGNQPPEPSIAAAQASLPFTIQLPQDLGDPISVFANAPPNLPDGAAVALVYDTKAYGRVVVFEQLPDVPDPASRLKSYQTAVSYNGQPDVHGTATLVTIHGDVPALITTSEDKSMSDISWVENAVETFVRGPSLTADEATTIAEGNWSQTSPGPTATG
jgi:hypothetical protein